MTRFLLTIVAGMLAVQAASSPCDPALAQASSDPNGYRLRGDRCEGLYIQPVSGRASLVVASFVEAFADFDARNTRELRLDWTPASPSTPTFLRAYGLRRRQYYRMDATPPAGSRSYLWPATILGNLDLSRQYLGIVAWTDMATSAQSNRRVYLPLRVGGGSNVERGYELAIVPGVELTEVYLTLAAVSEDGRPLRSYMQRQPLRHGYYPAQQAIMVPLTGVDRIGLHRLDIAVTQRDGGSANTEVWFLHTGR